MYRTDKAMGGVASNGKQWEEGQAMGGVASNGRRGKQWEEGQAMGGVASNGRRGKQWEEGQAMGGGASNGRSGKQWEEWQAMGGVASNLPHHYQNFVSLWTFGHTPKPYTHTNTHTQTYTHKHTHTHRCHYITFTHLVTHFCSSAWLPDDMYKISVSVITRKQLFLGDTLGCTTCMLRVPRVERSS